MGKDADRRRVSLWLFADVAAFNLAILTAFAFRLGRSSWAFNFAAYLEILPFALAVPLLIFALSRVSKTDWVNAAVEDYITLLRPVFFSWVVIIMVAYIYRTGTAGRLPSSVMLMTLPLAGGYILGWRLLARRLLWAGRLRREPRSLLGIGFAGASLKVLRVLAAGRYRLLGVLCDSRAAVGGDSIVSCLGGIRDLPRVLAEYDVDEVVVEGTEMHNSNASVVLKACENAGVSIRVVPTMLSMLTSRAHVEMVGFVPTISYGPLRIEGWSALVKRVMDVLAAMVLLVVLSPVLAFCAVWIALDSPGGFLFRQKRVGKNSKCFTLYKFRTMHTGSEHKGALTRRDDPRITRAGRFLRKWSLDELPQLVNVILGEMSLVGPRAVVPYVADRFDEFERITLNVLPGITGLAQVNGRDDLAFKDKSLLNLYYITNYSAFLDLELMFRTLGVVVRRQGTNGTRIQQHPAHKAASASAAVREPVEAGNAL
ncbi:MAG: sugar transferase [Planctomycetes bacterium]|nr:sugar transferase [Planctomycetota bacterium]